MVGRVADGLLGPDDPAPFRLFNAQGSSPFLLIGDHAGSAVPAVLGNLGLDDTERGRHIAIDIGVFGLGHALARLLDAPFLHQVYSRLVIDCNRDPARTDAIPIWSDGTRIGGNEGLDDAARAARIAAIHAPYHKAISELIDARQAVGRETILISLHSFTPCLEGIARPWKIGILHWIGNAGFSLAMLGALRLNAGLIVGDNEPYAMDATDYTVPFHAFPSALRYAEIEIRQDLIEDVANQELWAKRILIAALRATRRARP
jgi:predicted N-formylglutamate amidohydrolase